MACRINPDVFKQIKGKEPMRGKAVRLVCMKGDGIFENCNRLHSDDDGSEAFRSATIMVKYPGNLKIRGKVDANGNFDCGHCTN